MELFGRRKVYTDFDVIDESNLRQAVGEACAVHAANRREIEYLEQYMRGRHDILLRHKTVRPDLTYNIVINRAKEIIDFKVPYFLGESISYVSAENGTAPAESIDKLNNYMRLAGKRAADAELTWDFMTYGVSYRFAYPKKDESAPVPFVIETFDPKTTFVAYRKTSSRDSEPVFAVTYVQKRKQSGTSGSGRVYDVYTADWHYIMTGQEIKKEPNTIGAIPIIEYIGSQLRIGEFEAVKSLIDAGNVTTSNRVEGTAQNVQSLTWLNDIELDDDQKDELKEKPSAFIMTKSVSGSVKPNIEAITTNLQQADQQVLTNDIYKNILSVVGMPSQGDGNTSDSSNNGSTIVRNGWYQAKERADAVEPFWVRSDNRFLDVVLRILKATVGFNLRPEDVMCKFTRRNYEDASTKSTVLTTLLGSGKVAPKDAFRASDLFPDPDRACRDGVAWYEQERAKQQEIEAKQNANS